MSAEQLILIAPGVLLLGAALQILLAPLLSPRAKGIMAFCSAVPAFAAVVATVGAVRNGLAVEASPVIWDSTSTLAFHVDALSVLFALMGTGIGALVLLYSVGYMAQERSATRFYATMLAFIAGFVGLVYSANLFLVYLSWELIGLCSFSLVGFWYQNREAVAGARKVLLMTHIAGYGLLAAILVLYARSGTALWTDPRVAQGFTGGVFALMLVALVAKSVQFPLHTWIPEAMAAPTPVSALLHAACYVKAGVYLAARMHSLGAWPLAWSSALIWVGTITMAVGVMYAMVQSDLKRMLAYSTVSQIGYMMMGLGIGTPLAITAGLLHCLNHGFFKGGLFLTAGSVQHAAGTRDMNLLGGLSQKMPKTTLSWLIGAGSMAGVPLMSGFASKWMLYSAALDAGWYAPAIIAWVASLGTVFLCAKATSTVFLGDTTPATEHAHEATPTMVWGMALLAAGSIVLGIAPQLAVNSLLSPAIAALGLGGGVQVTWLGLSANAGAFSSMGGLVLAVVSLVAGGLVYLVAYAGRPAVTATVGGGVFTGGEPLVQGTRLSAKDFSEIFEQSWQGFFRWTAVDQIYLGLGRAFLGMSRALATLVAPLERTAAVSVVALTVIVFALLRWVAPASGVSLAGIEPAVPTLLTGAIALAAAALLLASLVSGAKRKLPLWPCVLVVGALTVAGLLVSNEWARIGLLEAAALLTVVRVWIAASSARARFAYLAVVLVSVGCAVSGATLQHTQPELARALLLTGILVKLAALPMLFWLLALADELPVLVLGLIIAVVDMAAFAEFTLTAQTMPSLLAPQGLLIGISSLTALLGALLMLAQRSLKRMLVLSTVEDVGFLLLGLASLNQLGLEGATLAAATHALAKALLFISLAAPEKNGELDGQPTALASRYPLSAFGFLFGMLAMLGVPPLMGFAGRWRLYTTAFELGSWTLATFIFSSILALIAYTLALTRIWWGPPAETTEPAAAVAARPEPRLLQLLIVLLAAALLLAGAWPALLTFFGGRP